MTSKHRVTLLPDGVQVSNLQPVAKRRKECYESVMPGHIPKIRVCMNLQDDSEEISIKIPVNVLDRIPMLKDFQQLAKGELLDVKPVQTLPVDTGDAASAGEPDTSTAAAKSKGRSSAQNPGHLSKGIRANCQWPKQYFTSLVGSVDAESGSNSHAGTRDPVSSEAIQESGSAVLQLPGGLWGLLVMLKVLLDRHIDLDRVLLVDAIEPAGAAALAVCLSLTLRHAGRKRDECTLWKPIFLSASVACVSHEYVAHTAPLVELCGMYIRQCMA